MWDKSPNFPDLRFLSDTLRGLVQRIARSLLDPESPSLLSQTVNWVILNNLAELVSPSISAISSRKKSVQEAR